MQKNKLFVFPYNDDNDYQNLYVKDLEDTHDVFKIRNEDIFPLIYISKDAFLIIEWLSPYCISNNSFVSFLKSCLFISQVIYIKIFKNVTVIQNIHNHSDHEIRSPIIEYLLKHALARLANKLRFFSYSSLNSYTKIYGGKSKSNVSYHPIYKRPEFREEKKHFDLIFFGNIRKYKGILSYLNSVFLDKLSKNNHNILLAGRLHESIDIEKYDLSHKSLKCDFSFISNGLLNKYLGRSRYIFLPYDEITTSGVLYLAMAHDIPVIVRPLPFFVEILGTEYPFFYHNDENILNILNNKLEIEGVYTKAIKKIFNANTFRRDFL